MKQLKMEADKGELKDEEDKVFKDLQKMMQLKTD